MKDCSLWVGGWRVSLWRNCVGSWKIPSVQKCHPCSRYIVLTHVSGLDRRSMEPTSGLEPMTCRL